MAFLYLTEQGASITKTGNRLIVQKEGKKLLDIPAGKVEGVMIFGNVQFTTQAARLLLENGIETALFSTRGKLLGQLTAPATKNITLRLAQFAKASDRSFVGKLASGIVGGKIGNALNFVKGFSGNHPETDLGGKILELGVIAAKAGETHDPAALRGLEGIAARIYFGAFARMIRHSFSFEGRRKHPATDPVNALLSLGYTMVYNEISWLLDGMGFDPYLGYFHQPKYGHATLASDLLEEFRAPLVDRLTLTLINNRVFSKADFFHHGPSGGIYLKTEPRKRYFVEYDRFVSRPMTHTSEETDPAYRELFRRQARRLQKTVTDEEAYTPYQFKWYLKPASS